MRWASRPPAGWPAAGAAAGAAGRATKPASVTASSSTGVIHRAERAIATCVRFMRWAPSVERSPQLYATPSMSVNENHPSHDRQVPELTRFAGTRTIRARMDDALVDSHVDRDDARAQQRERTETCPTCGTASVSGSTGRTECLATRADVS